MSGSWPRSGSSAVYLAHALINSLSTLSGVSEAFCFSPLLTHTLALASQSTPPANVADDSSRELAEPSVLRMNRVNRLVEIWVCLQLSDGTMYFLDMTLETDKPYDGKSTDSQVCVINMIQHVCLHNDAFGRPRRKWNANPAARRHSRFYAWARKHLRLGKMRFNGVNVFLRSDPATP